MDVNSLSHSVSWMPLLSTKVKAMLFMRWRRALRNRHTGGGCKTLIGAPGKSRGAERIRKGKGKNVSCVSQSWTKVKNWWSIVKTYKRSQNRCFVWMAGEIYRKPVYWIGGCRCWGYRNATSSSRRPKLRSVRCLILPFSRYDSTR